jgi:hypothetical protein
MNEGNEKKIEYALNWMKCSFDSGLSRFLKHRLIDQIFDLSILRIDLYM